MPHFLIGGISPGLKQVGAKTLRSQQLNESLLATTKNRMTGSAVKFCRREPTDWSGAISTLVVELLYKV